MKKRMCNICGDNCHDCPLNGIDIEELKKLIFQNKELLVKYEKYGTQHNT